MADTNKPKTQSANKTKKSKKKKKNRNKPHGHFCYVCGQHKAHEKFSGRGHANHICKVCKSLPVAERNEMIAVRKIENMAFRYLNEQEIKWLRKKTNDPRPEVQETAREVHSLKFPRYERNIIKKGLTVRSLEFFIHGEVWNDYGDEMSVHMRFFADNSGTIRRIDYDKPDGEQETIINIGQQPALKFLKAVVHQLDALFWSEDFSDADPDDFDPYIDILPEFRPDYDNEEDFDLDGEDEDNAPDTNENKEPIWSLRLVLNKGGEKTQTFYNQMHEGPRELFWELMEWFEPEDEDFDDGFDEDSENDNEN